ncbi:hypothetical protein ECANGB1_174 [Enterospora canceri]|uniref:Uncharacterized protein n=1 Tax=Enterospora canceri TaxID=1081671 RepID=A0A1Y1S4K7_9MICR|nr:hypothetical protein ECANGB1_174 [Enterospora canceri]
MILVHLLQIHSSLDAYNNFYLTRYSEISQYKTEISSEYENVGVGAFSFDDAIKLQTLVLSHYHNFKIHKPVVIERIPQFKEQCKCLINEYNTILNDYKKSKEGNLENNSNELKEEFRLKIVDLYYRMLPVFYNSLIVVADGELLIFDYNYLAEYSKFLRLNSVYYTNIKHYEIIQVINDLVACRDMLISSYKKVEKLKRILLSIRKTIIKVKNHIGA